MRVDFFASHPHYVDHAAPVWFALPEANRGAFISPHLDRAGIVSTEKPDPSRLCVFLSYGESRHLTARKRLAFLAHGAEQMYGNTPPVRKDPRIELILTNPNAHARSQQMNPKATVLSLGCPKMDAYHGREFPRHDPPVIAVSHHWHQRNIPEASSAYPWSADAIVALSKRFTVLGHKHPADKRDIQGFYAHHGIEFVPDFSDILDRADLYICDNSSTLYEFAATDRPVVCLSPPDYRRRANHGLRFWGAIPGVECAVAHTLTACVEEALCDTPARQELRRKAVHAAYGQMDGQASLRAAEALLAIA